MILDIKNAGTVMRFLTAYLSLIAGKWLITGSERMQKRPIGELVDALNSLGADIQFTQKIGFPPLLIKGAEIKGGVVEINAKQSSQFVSALMMIAPYLKNGLEIIMKHNPVSAPYIKMTAKLMSEYGVNVEIDSNTIFVPEGNYKIKEHNIEADWSSASYWYEVAALSENSEIFISNLSKKSIQGDSIVAQIFKNLGVETIYLNNGVLLKNKETFKTEYEFNFKDYPDLVPAVMATCAIKGIKLKVKGISHLKYKESDRILSLDEELSKIGCCITKEGKSYILTSGESVNNVEFNTHNDHRLAMCLAPLVLKIKDVVINDPEVSTKSYPDFWKNMKDLNVFDYQEL
jgi:3-phosphoshikimate 1-carboxyvinyltransferase